MDYFDLHCDTAYECYFKNKDFLKNDLAVSAEKGGCFEKWSQVFAVWIRDDLEEPYKLYREILNGFKNKLSGAPDNLTPYFAVEGGAVIGRDSDRLYGLKEDGVIYLTLTWNGENRLAGGSKTDKGLTRFGREVIKKLNCLKMCCDLSHLNDKSFFAAADEAEYPIASHSNSRSVCGVPRNLTDEQLELIGKRNGLIGLCFYNGFLGGNTYDKIYENIEHMLYMGLEDSIAVGSDFDGADTGEQLADISCVPRLYTALNKKGIEKKLLDKIFYKNAQNYFDKMRLL